MSPFDQPDHRAVRRRGTSAGHRPSRIGKALAVSPLRQRANLGRRGRREHVATRDDLPPGRRIRWGRVVRCRAGGRRLDLLKAVDPGLEQPPVVADEVGRHHTATPEVEHPGAELTGRAVSAPQAVEVGEPEQAPGVLDAASVRHGLLAGSQRQPSVRLQVAEAEAQRAREHARPIGDPQAFRSEGQSPAAHGVRDVVGGHDQTGDRIPLLDSEGCVECRVEVAAPGVSGQIGHLHHRLDLLGDPRRGVEPVEARPAPVRVGRSPAQPHPLPEHRHATSETFTATAGRPTAS